MALGKSSLVISLPKEWLRSNSLNRGDTVSMNIQPDLSLIVHPSSQTRDKHQQISISIKSDETKDSIVRQIIGCYLNGYDTITLHSKAIFNEEQQTAIREVVKSLYLRIIESAASKVVMQTLMDESMASVSSGVERMHIITSSMCQDVLNAMKQWDEDLAKSVVHLEDDVDSFMYLLVRLIRSSAVNPTLAHQLGLDLVDCLDYQTLVHRIEYVADHLTLIAHSLINLFKSRIFMPKESFPVLIETAEVAFNAYDRAVLAFQSMSVDHSNEIIDVQEEVDRLEECITPLPYYGEREEKNVLCYICVIRDSIKRIAEYSADIAELTIDRVYKLS